MSIMESTRKNMASLWFAIAITCLSICTGARAGSASDQLDHLQRVFATSPQFGEKFWQESKKVADWAGPRILDAVMLRSKQWRGEEGLVFVPLVALLPRGPVLALLHQYERSPVLSCRTWAKEFLIEIDSPMCENKGQSRFLQFVIDREACGR
ncbi:MAG: hypothetical protein M3R59_03020 [Verrucomicrobiota bacterium]|nr:hypothetical protein [Verrucomicrobiota bacterium]